MTRGKYEAQAARRRAQSAEEQLDRLLPKLVDAQRMAQRYREEAGQAEILRRQLRELRDKHAIPVSTHEETLRQIELETSEVIAGLEDAIGTVLRYLVRRGLIVDRDVSQDIKYVNDELLLALAVLPETATLPLLIHLGWDREMRRRGPTIAGALMVRESLFGRDTHHAGLTEVDGELASKLRAFHSARRDGSGAHADDPDQDEQDQHEQDHDHYGPCTGHDTYLPDPRKV